MQSELEEQNRTKTHLEIMVTDMETNANNDAETRVRNLSLKYVKNPPLM